MDMIWDIGPIINLNVIEEKLQILANLDIDTQNLELGYYFLCDVMLLMFTEDELVAGLIMYLNALVEHDLPLEDSTMMIEHFVYKVTALDHSVTKPVAIYTYSKLLPRELPFAEQLAMIRQLLANIYELEGKWAQAIQVLKEIQLDSGLHGQFSADYKLGTYLRLSRFSLEINKVDQAETYINRAALEQVDAEDEDLHLDFKVGYACVLDFQHRFIDAAQHFNDLAGENISDEYRYAALRRAVTCTLLSSPGKQRSRLLARFYNDERTHSMELSNIIEKMYHDLHVQRSELKAFEMSLMPHQKMILAHGCTILELVLVQHNLIAASKVHQNITFLELSEILEIDPVRLERIADEMISENILNGIINRSASLINFV